MLARPANTEDTLKLSFQVNVNLKPQVNYVLFNFYLTFFYLRLQMFDQNEKGHINLADLQAILYSAFSMPPNEVKKLFEKINSKNDGFITFG